MSYITAAVMAVDDYNQNVSDPSLYDVKTFVENVWKSEIEDGSDQYESIFHVVGLEIKDHKWKSQPTYRERADKVDNWLYNNYDQYNVYDVIIVLDHHDEMDKSGVAQSKAGTSRDKICLINAKDLKANNTLHQPNPVEKIAAHEYIHMFIDESDREHYPRVRTSNAGIPQKIGSLMYHIEWSGGNCYYGKSPDTIEDRVSQCTRGIVRDFIENNM